MRLYLFTLCTCLFLLSGCAQKEFTQNAPEVLRAKDDTPKRQEIIKNAMKHQGKKDGGDCSGFVTLVNQLKHSALLYNCRAKRLFWKMQGAL